MISSVSLLVISAPPSDGGGETGRWSRARLRHRRGCGAPGGVSRRGIHGSGLTPCTDARPERRTRKGLLLNFPCGSHRTTPGRRDDGDARDVDPTGGERALGLACRRARRQHVVAEHHHGAGMPLREAGQNPPVHPHRTVEVRCTLRRRELPLVGDAAHPEYADRHSGHALPAQQGRSTSAQVPGGLVPAASSSPWPRRHRHQDHRHPRLRGRHQPEHRARQQHAQRTDERQPVPLLQAEDEGPQQVGVLPRCAHRSQSRWARVRPYGERRDSDARAAGPAQSPPGTTTPRAGAPREQVEHGIGPSAATRLHRLARLARVAPHRSMPAHRAQDGQPAAAGVVETALSRPRSAA